MASARVPRPAEGFTEKGKMAEPRVVATVVRIDGQVFARNADGEVRLLKEGDTLREGEVVITGAGSRVELAYADGGSTSIPAVRCTLRLEGSTILVHAP